MSYAMRIEALGTRSVWEECKAQTLIGAKREASARYQGYASFHRIVVALIHERPGGLEHETMAWRCKLGWIAKDKLARTYRRMMA